MIKKIILSIGFVFIFAHLGFGENSAWNKKEDRHFVIYYQNAPHDFVENVAQTAEELYTEITRNLGFVRYQNWSFEERAKIYIYDDREEYKANARNMEWSGGMTFVNLKEIRTYAADYGFFDSTLPHELGHIIFHEFIQYNPVPLWLDEGVAMYQEKAKRWGANKVVQGYLESGKFIPLDQLTSDKLRNNPTEENVNIFYAEAASIVYYMITEEGEYRFATFCRKLTEGIKFEEALQQSYGRFRDLKSLNEAWVSYLKDLK